MVTLSPGTIRRIQAVLDAVPNAIFIKNRDHRMVMVNSSACEFFGHSRDVMLSHSDWDLYPREQVEIFHAVDERVFASGEIVENEEEITDGEGKVRYSVTRKRPIYLDGVPFLIGVITDVTAIRNSEAHTRYLALHDALTDLPNRALLNERIERALLRTRRNKGHAVLVYIDLDRFKSVNDTLGHAAGDELLCEFASRLRMVARASDTVARLGGDEFAVLLEDVDERFDGKEFAQRVVSVAARAFELAGAKKVHVGASVGITPLPRERVDSAELHRRADVALYEAKNAGRGCFRLFSKVLDKRTRRRRRIESDLRLALITGEQLAVHYQPLVGADGRLQSVEALVRWDHPELGALTPTEFIPIAEESGLIVTLGEWVLEQAATMMAKWPEVPVALNVSAAQLRTDDFPERVLTILERTGMKPAQLEIEVTETAIFDTSGAASKLRRLRAAGVQVVLGDFGTGYSSLAHLQRLEIDRVKIDQSFVRKLSASDDSRAIVLAVLGIGKSLGIRVTAEGVETEAQRAFLRASGCDEFQGFPFSHPLDAAHARAYLDHALKRQAAA